MSDQGTGTEDLDRLPEPAAPGMADAVLRSSAEHALGPGKRWREFAIGEQVEGSGAVFRGENVSTMEEVLVHARPVTESTEWRRGAWERLAAMRNLPIIPCLEAIEEDGWRYEVTALPPSMTMRGWIACHRANDEELEAFIGRISPVLAAMHREGVVHLNVRPETIFIEETARGLEFFLGGLQSATLYTQPRLTPAEVDPFYAPPEAAGLTSHPPGTRLCAWDWWSLGRIAQEYVLGQHVLGLVLQRDVSRPTPELRAKAEELLLERGAQGHRAGGVEEMPEMGAATTALMRGLLSSSGEARWGADAVQRWLRHEPVRDHYDLPRTGRLWSWKGRGFTIAEAVEFFTQEANWEDGEYNLFTTEDPETLAHFLEETPRYRDEWERLKAALDLAELPVWERVQPAAQRPAIAAAGWLALAGISGATTQLRVRGRVIDAEGLMQWLGDPGLMDAAAMVNALLVPPFVKFVEPLDAAAGRVLSMLATVGGEAVRIATEQGWLDPQDGDRHSRILILSLQPVRALRDALTRLKSFYATSQHATLAKWLSQSVHEPWELVLLAYTGESAHRHEFISHTEWARKRTTELTIVARRLATALFWLQLRQVLRFAAPGGRPWISFGISVVALSAAGGVMARSLVAAGGIAAIALLTLLGALWWVRRTSTRMDPDTSMWGWRDGEERCEREIARFPAEAREPPRVLAEKLRGLRGEIARLGVGTAHDRSLPESEWWPLVAMVAGGVAMGLLLLVSAARPPASARAERVPEISRIQESVTAERDPDAPPTREELLATGRYEVVDDGFGRGLRGPLEPWTFRPPAEVPVLAVQARAPASANQTAHAVVSATLLLQPYPRRAVNVLLAVHVPTTRGFGVMIFNTRDRKLLGSDVILVASPLQASNWYRLGSRRVLFLGRSPVMAEEISLAPP